MLYWIKSAWIYIEIWVNFNYYILKPLNWSSFPILAVATPLPTADITPPVTNTNLQLVGPTFSFIFIQKIDIIQIKNKKYQTQLIRISGM